MTPLLPRRLRRGAATARRRLHSLAPGHARPPFLATRLFDRPIIGPELPGLEGERGASINGPSLIRVPDWVESPLGSYYLYFAHHHGTEIRVAYADRLEGPWAVLPHGVLELAHTAARGHIASPDVHVDHERRRLRMYFHGCAAGDVARQVSFLATSEDGLRFTAAPEILAPFYLRVFEHGARSYGIAKRGNRSGVLLRSPGGAAAFEAGPSIIPRMRHAAVLARDDEVWVFYSRIGDAPESVMAARLELGGDWAAWRPTRGALVLAPERSYEGVDQPVEPSRPGRPPGRRRELRDPAIHVEDGRTFLLYAVAGEQGIAVAELRPGPV